VGKEITIKSPADIKILREGGKRLAEILGVLAKAVRPGVKKRELDELAEKMILEGGDMPSFKNYKPDGAQIAFPASLCVSVNEEIVHGIPTDQELKNGDIVGLDLGLIHKGLFTDSAVTVAVGEIDDKAKRLMDVTKKALAIGIKTAKAGATTGDVGHAIEKFVHPFKLGIVRDLSGHGVGYAVHEPPYVPNYGKSRTGVKLRPGMVIAIEIMLTECGEGIKVGKDRFSFVTCDNSRSAHFEHTLVITEKGAKVLTSR